MQSRRPIRLFVILVLVVPFVAWLAVSFFEKRVGELPVLGKEDHRIEDFELLNQDGLLKGTAGWNGKIVVADFFFTHCPTICPKMTMSLKKVRSSFENDTTVLINSISIDPERDSSSRLKEYAGDFGINTKNWELLTGDKKEIYRMARNSFMVVATDGDGGPDDFIHSESLVLIDRRKRIRGYYDGTNETEVKQLIRDIKKLKNEK